MNKLAGLLLFAACTAHAGSSFFQDGVTFGQSVLAPQTGLLSQTYAGTANAQSNMQNPYIQGPPYPQGAQDLMQDGANGVTTGLGSFGTDNLNSCLSYNGTDPARMAECNSIKMLSKNPIENAKAANPLQSSDFLNALGAMQNPSLYAPDFTAMAKNASASPSVCTTQSTTQTTYQQQSCYTYLQQVDTQNSVTTVVPPSSMSINCVDNITPASTSSWTCEKSVPIIHVCDDVVTASVVQKQVCATPTVTMLQGFQAPTTPYYFDSNNVPAGPAMYSVGGSCNTDGTMSINVSISAAWLQWNPNYNNGGTNSSPYQSVTLTASSGSSTSGSVAYALQNYQHNPEPITLTASWDGVQTLTISSSLDSQSPGLNTPAGASNILEGISGAEYLAPTCPAENPPVSLNNGQTLCYAASGCPAGYTAANPGFTEAPQPPAGVIGQAWYAGAWYNVNADYTVAAVPGSILTISGSVWTAYACPQGFTQTGSTCVENYGATGAYVCPTGTALTGTQCVTTTTSSAAPTYSCPAGQTLSGTQCLTTTTSTAVSNYTCPAGETLSGTQCVFSTTNGATPSYSCPAGTSLSGTQCVSSSSYTAASSEQCPSGGMLVAYGSSYYCVTQSQSPSTIYSCPAGGSLSGTTCDSSSTYSASVSGYSCSNVPGTRYQTGSQCYVYGYPLSQYGFCGPPMSGYSGGEFYAAGQMWCGSYNTGTPIYTCNSGDTLSGTTCIHTSTAAATGSTGCSAGVYVPGYNICALSYYAASLVYSCPSGGSLSGSTCTSSSSSGASVTYSCPFGGTLSGSTCIVSGSSGATQNYSCPAGATLSGSQCYTTTATGAAVTYSCPTGQALSGTTCTATSSTGAMMNYACPAGGILSGTTCTITANGSFTGTGPYLPAATPVPVCQGTPVPTLYKITGSSTTPAAISADQNGCAVWANM